MDLELLTIPGCPHAGPAMALFRAALDLEDVKDPVAVRELGTEAEAAALAFHGSPTFSIDGADLFPSSATPALACRVYPTPTGLSGQPTLHALRQAIRASLPTTGGVNVS
jgi:hypothetical protein